MTNSHDPMFHSLRIQRGATLREAFLYGAPPWIYKPITGATKAAPCVLSVADHGVPDGWPIMIGSVSGMHQLNRGDPSDPQPCDIYFATVTDDDEIELNDVDASGFSAYRGGGHIRYATPVDLTGMTARAEFFDEAGNSILVLTSEDDEIDISIASSSVTLVMTDEQSEALESNSGTYKLDLLSGGEVIRLTVGDFHTGCC